MLKAIGFVLLLVSSTASAQYKCTDASGKVAFQQTPCAMAEKEQKVRVFIGEPPKVVATLAAGQPPVLNADQRMLVNIERERRMEEKSRSADHLERQIAYLQDVINRRNGQMSGEIASLQHKKMYAKNNLAGATWEQSISAEMQAVTQKYKTMNDVDF